MNSGKSEVVTISRRGVELAIEQGWFVKGQTIRDTVFAVVWNGFLGFLFFEALSLVFFRLMAAFRSSPPFPPSFCVAREYSSPTGLRHIG